MKNLAGDSDCDRDIVCELERCGIEVVRGDQSNGEVPYTATGRLGEFEFHRAWRYWVVKGKVPLPVARELYADIGKAVIRVDGHCGCPAPEDPWITRYDSAGKKIAQNFDGKEKGNYKRLVDSGLLKQDGFDALRWVDTPEERGAATAAAFVEQYHIDTELGLRIFVDTLKKHGLAKPAKVRIRLEVIR